MSKGFQELNTSFNLTNALDFFTDQKLKSIFTCDIVKVINVDEKTVDIQPLVYQVNGDNEIMKQEPIYGVPYCRQQAGMNGIILKPQVGDLGVVVYARRDISSVISSGGENVPDTRRFLSENDAIYLCSIASIMSPPTRFIEFSDSGIKIKPSMKLTIDGNVEINGDTVSQTLNAENGYSGIVYTGSNVLTFLNGILISSEP